MDTEKIQAFNDQQKLVEEENAKTMDTAFAVHQIIKSQKDVEESVKQSILGLVKFLAKNQPSVSVVNQQPFPSYDEVVKAVNQVVQEVKNSNKSLATVEQKEADYSPIVEALDKLSNLVEKLPTEIPEGVEEVTVKNQVDYTPKFDEVTKAIGKLPAPIVNVPKTEVPDNSEELDKILRAVEKIKFPDIPQTDITPLLEATNKVNKTISNLSFPVPNYVLPFKNAQGAAVQVQLTSDGKLPVDVTLSPAAGGATSDNQTNGAQKTQIVDPAGNSIDSLIADTGQYGLLVGIGPTNYVLSTNNSSTAQLAAGATFTGVIESVFNEPEASVLLTIDQNATLTINQYIDAAGTYVVSSWVYAITAGAPFSRSFVINGNYMNFVLRNNGGSTTATLNLNVAYGTIPAATNLGNAPIALSEINGVALASGSGTTSTGVQRVVLPTDQPLNLPTGAATSANQALQATAALQTTGNTSLSSIDTKLNSQATASNQTSGVQKTRITDGVVDANVTGSGELNVLETNSTDIKTNTANTATSLAVIDDWDESDRAKVNLIVGQAGVAAGAGTVSATTQRVVLPTDQTAIPITDNGGSLTIDATSLPLPTNAATSALQTTGNSSLSSIDTKLSGTIIVDDPAPTTLVPFLTTVATAGTRVQLASNSIVAGVLQAPSTNTGIIYVGGSTVSSSSYGAELQPGQSTGIAIDNTNKLYIDASVNGDKCAFLGS